MVSFVFYNVKISVNLRGGMEEGCLLLVLRVGSGVNAVVNHSFWGLGPSPSLRATSPVKGEDGYIEGRVSS